MDVYFLISFGVNVPKDRMYRDEGLRKQIKSNPDTCLDIFVIFVLRFRDKTCYRIN